MEKEIQAKLEELSTKITIPLDVYVCATMNGIFVKDGETLRHVPVLYIPPREGRNRTKVQGFVHPYDPFEFYPFSEYKETWWIQPNQKL